MSFKRIKRLFELLKSKKYRELGKILKQSFTRNRKMSFFDLAICILNRRGKTLTLELKNYMKEIGKDEITKQAFSKQRQNLNPEIFRVLDEEYIKMIYKEREIKTYKGYVVLGVDGSMMELPNCNELKEYYGIQLGQPKSVGRVRARAMGIYDCLNNIMVRTRIDKYNVSEKEQIEKELEKLKKMYKHKKIILVCDRLYFGISFIHLLDKMGIKYLIRMQNKHYKKEKLEMASNDEVVDLKIRTNSIFYAETEAEKQELKKIKKVSTRIIKTTIPTGEEEHISTNIDKKELTEEEAKELYFGRWNIEKAFDIIKNKINIENMSSHTAIGVEQDFYSQMLLYNMLEDIKSDSEVEQDPNKKYEYKVNMNIMVGLFREKLINIFLKTKSKDIDKAQEEFITEIKKYLVPIKPGRSFERKRMHSMNKYRHNLRRNS